MKEAIQIIRTIIMFAMYILKYIFSNLRKYKTKKTRSARIRSVSNCDFLLDHAEHSRIENSPMISTLKVENITALELKDDVIELEAI